MHMCLHYSPLVQAAVYDGVVHCRAHGKEEDCEIHLLNVLLLVDVFLEAPQDEVYVIGQPADCKNDHHYHHRLHKLGKQKQGVIPGPWVTGLAGAVRSAGFTLRPVCPP